MFPYPDGVDWIEIWINFRPMYCKQNTLDTRFHVYLKVKIIPILKLGRIDRKLGQSRNEIRSGRFPLTIPR